MVLLTVTVFFVFGSLLTVVISNKAPTTFVLGGYATSMTGRTISQRKNAGLAAVAIDGVRIGPGSIFSYNQVVGSWSIEPRYVRAPVSFDGRVVLAMGGGVCQTSSTLYNAALLAGLDIVERHPHFVAPGYIPAGRDAAVAWPGVDLRIRNPWPWPVRLSAAIKGQVLDVRVTSLERPNEQFAVTTRVVRVEIPEKVGRKGPLGMRGSMGSAGFDMLAFRTRYKPGVAARRECLSEDHYARVDGVRPLAQ